MSRLGSDGDKDSNSSTTTNGTGEDLWSERRFQPAGADEDMVFHSCLLVIEDSRQLLHTPVMELSVRQFPAVRVALPKMFEYTSCGKHVASVGDLTK